MKKFFSARPKLCVTIFFLIIFGPAFGITCLNFLKIYELEKNRVREESVLVLKLTQIREEQMIAESRDLLNFLAWLPQTRSMDKEKCDETFIDFLSQHKEYANIALLASDGMLISSGLETDQSINVAYRVYFQKMKTQKSFVVGQYVIGAVSGKPVLPFVQPVFDSSGEIKGAVAVYRDLS